MFLNIGQNLNYTVLIGEKEPGPEVYWRIYLTEHHELAQKD